MDIIERLIKKRNKYKMLNKHTNNNNNVNNGYIHYSTR
jgi:hypothetical protein